MNYASRVSLPETADLGPIKRATHERWGGRTVDLTVGNPIDPMPPSVFDAIAVHSGHERYPVTAGIEGFREAAAYWMSERHGVHLTPGVGIAPTLGSKAYLGTLPWHLRKLLSTSGRDMVLIPELSYATLTHSVQAANVGQYLVRFRDDGQLDLGAIPVEVTDRALCLIVNSPHNPTGRVLDLAEIAAWGRENNIVVVSDESYTDFVWHGSQRDSLMRHGCDGMISVVSLTKSFNFGGWRCGFVAGDPQIVNYITEWNKFTGIIPPRASQAAAMDVMRQPEFADRQAERYITRLSHLRKAFIDYGLPCEVPQGGLYLWVDNPVHTPSGMELALGIAHNLGVLVTPGNQFGSAGRGHVRISAMVSDHDLHEVLVPRVAQFLKHSV